MAGPSATRRSALDASGGRSSGLDLCRTLPALRRSGSRDAPMAQQPRPLAVDCARKQVETGEIDTVIVAFTDMQGRLQGKRMHAQFFLDDGARARHRGLQLPARRRRRHEHRRRATRSARGQRGYGDMEFVARPGHAAPAPRGCPAPRWCSATWPGSTTSTPGRRSRRGQILKAQARPRAPTRGLAALRRHRAGVHRLRRHLRGRPGPALPRPDAGQPVQRRLLARSAPAGSSRCCATSATTCTPPG